MNEKPQKIPFKERWLLEDEKCPTCNQITKRQTGMTKQNIRRLLIPTWNWNEVFITFMLIMIILLAFMYKAETQSCRDFLKNMSDTGTCYRACANIAKEVTTKELNVTNLNLTRLNP